MAKKEVINRNAENLNKILIENFVNLQKVLTNLSAKFDSLSEQISKLLQLFEISAKSFGEKIAVGAPEIEKDREFLEKLDKLLEQNKVIAKGITLMEEKVRERVYGAQPQLKQTPTQFFRKSALQQEYSPSSFETEKERKTKEI